MGIIEIEGMEFYSYHGCFTEEQIVGNKFMVDLRLEADCSKAEISDHINDAVNYQIAYQIIKEEMAKKSHLLENIAYRILQHLFKKLVQIDRARVKVCKVNPPLGGKIQHVSVTLEKHKTDFQ
ncbi:MAG: dihydroneopterin aldolase [Salinivirgaceae bacterium]|nr:dihydroneopterin aldolase [Salinivirgaceae bacterium]